MEMEHHLEIHHIEQSDKPIVIYKIANSEPATLEYWGEQIITALQNWPEDQPYLAVYDLTHRGVALNFVRAMEYQIYTIGISSAANQFVQTYAETHPNFRARIATVFNLRYSGVMGNTLVMNRQPYAVAIDVVYKTFFDTDEAVNWLATAIK